ncbi:28344_t:CDS:2, partial [Gigaspora margarita]
MLQTIEEFTMGIEWLYSSQIQDLENNLTNTNLLWPNLWNRLNEIQDQKEAIREEIIKNLTRKKTEKTFYEACGKNNTVQQPRYKIVIAWKKSIGIGRKAKWKSKPRLTEVRSKRILKERKEALELERLEDKGAPSSNTSSQEEKRWKIDQLQLECLEKFITKG